VVSQKLKQLLNTSASLIEAGDYQQGLKTLQKANEVAEKSGDALDRFQTLTALGSTYARAGQPEKALIEFTRAMNLCVFADLGAFAAGVCLASTSHVYFDLNMLSECEETAQNSFQILNQDLGEDGSAIVVPLEALIKVSIEQADHDKARKYIRQTIETAKKYPGGQSPSSIRGLIERIGKLPETLQSDYGAELAALNELKRQS
jgi:tetratricopeptide (TPR) repeat protein